MDSHNRKLSKTINMLGLIIWVILYFTVIPVSFIKKYPLILIGFFYSFIIQLTNYLLIGNESVDQKDEIDFRNENILKYNEMMNDKVIQISTTIFALSIAAETIFKKGILKEQYIFIVFSLIFGVGMIAPIYFISNYKKSEQENFNFRILRIKNVFLNYSLGFMMSSFMLTLFHIFYM